MNGTNKKPIVLCATKPVTPMLHQLCSAYIYELADR
jgi:hypothetical protein